MSPLWGGPQETPEDGPVGRRKADPVPSPSEGTARPRRPFTPGWTGARTQTYTCRSTTNANFQAGVTPVTIPASGHTYATTAFSRLPAAFRNGVIPVRPVGTGNGHTSATTSSSENATTFFASVSDVTM